MELGHYNTGTSLTLPSPVNMKEESLFAVLPASPSMHAFSGPGPEHKISSRNLGSSMASGPKSNWVGVNMAFSVADQTKKSPKLRLQDLAVPEAGDMEYDGHMRCVKRSRTLDSAVTLPCQTECLPTQTRGVHIQQSLPESSNIVSEEKMWVSAETSSFSFYNPLDEPSPLGLTLRKSPSLLELVSTVVTQGTANGLDSGDGNAFLKCKSTKGASASGIPQDKLKASNFPASTLTIGSWECLSRYEGDLVAKCYYAKRKLVWEILENGLKSKIEIQWSDIVDLKATCPEDDAGVLEIEVSRPPLFFRETNPQPRKHTLWQATSDFTNGQATICRRHFLQFPVGVLSKHYEKLIQCDPRLKALASGINVFKDAVNHVELSESYEDKRNQCHDYYSGNHVVNPVYSTMNPDLKPYDYDSNSFNQPTFFSKAESEILSIETHSPSSVMDGRGSEESGSSDEDPPCEIPNCSKYEGAYVGHVSCGRPAEVDQLRCLNGSTNCPSRKVTYMDRKILDEIAETLLGDSFMIPHEEPMAPLPRFQPDNVASVKEEESTGWLPISPIPSRTDFAQPLPTNMQGPVEGKGMIKPCKVKVDDHPLELDGSDETNLHKDSSCGDLLMNLPRIASLPYFIDTTER